MVVRVEALSTARQATCPGCGHLPERIHGSYLRFPHDLPTAGKSVVVALKVRRFVCSERSCPRKTFAEQAPGLTRRFGRRTERLRSTLISAGLALARRAGARITDVFGAPVSRNSPGCTSELPTAAGWSTRWPCTARSRAPARPEARPTPCWLSRFRR
ncbi:transposase family protein [Streptomyces stramineus]